jgi:hypothetical protein
MDQHDLHKIDCSYKARLFVLCMKKSHIPENMYQNTPSQILQKPFDNRCKHLFDNWYKCILLDDLKI